MFKVGDKVRRVGNDHPAGGFPVGKEGFVTGYVEDSNMFVLDNHPWIKHRSEHLELVTSVTSPVRTVTRREIIPGVYGRVNVGEGGYVGLTSCDFQHGTCMTADELREAAHTLNQIAEVLDDGE